MAKGRCAVGDEQADVLDIPKMGTHPSSPSASWIFLQSIRIAELDIHTYIQLYTLYTQYMYTVYIFFRHSHRRNPSDCEAINPSDCEALIET